MNVNGNTLSVKRIKIHSMLAMKELRKPVLLMVGPPTISQMDKGFGHLRNFRMHIFHLDKWWHCGGHVSQFGVITYWDKWSPSSGEWNRLGLKPETMRQLEKVVDKCRQAGLAPHFIKMERDQEDYEQMIQWILAQGIEKEENERAAACR